MRPSVDLERAGTANEPPKPAAAVRREKGVPGNESPEDLGALAREIAHDFNNILLSIQINAELLLAGEAEDGLTARRLGQILEAARRGRDRAGQLVAQARKAERGAPPAVGTSATQAERPELLPGGTERVLIVDDEESQVLAMSRLLRYLGYRVVGLSDPVEALERFRLDTGAFDLVIIDKNMPLISGTELAKEVLRIRPGMPVIMCTGYSETIDEERALAMGIRALVLKPTSVKEIAAVIRRVLRSET